MRNDEIHTMLGQVMARLDSLHGEHQDLRRVVKEDVTELRREWKADVMGLRREISANKDELTFWRSAGVIMKWAIGIAAAVFGAKLAGLWDWRHK